MAWHAEAVKNKSREPPKAHTCQKNASTPTLRGEACSNLLRMCRLKDSRCCSAHATASCEVSTRQIPLGQYSLRNVEGKDGVAAVHGFDCGALHGTEPRIQVLCEGEKALPERRIGQLLIHQLPSF